MLSTSNDTARSDFIACKEEVRIVFLVNIEYSAQADPLPALFGKFTKLVDQVINDRHDISPELLEFLQTSAAPDCKVNLSCCTTLLCSLANLQLS